MRVDKLYSHILGNHIRHINQTQKATAISIFRVKIKVAKSFKNRVIHSF